MIFPLPAAGKDPVPMPHFPTAHQAFIFRASEYVPAEKIAKILGTTPENVKKAAAQMGLPDYNPGEVWLQKGYITILRRMWHILPYSQLLELLEMDEDTLAFVLKEEDFLDAKLGLKPVCQEVKWRELTPEEEAKTAAIKEIMQKLSFDGAAPFDFQYNVPTIQFSGKPVYETRMIYAFSGLYMHAFDVDSEVYCSDAQLEAYQKLGINGLWAQGVLSQLAEFPFEPSISKGYKERLQRMRDFTERLEKYGIKLYLYLNEPRSMPLGFFDKHPELKGHEAGGKACLCTSVEAVQNYLTDAVESVCRAVPKLGGFFTITRSENPTNCYSRSGRGTWPECNCPRCKERTAGDVVGETIRCMLDGARRVSEDIKVFAWSWGWFEDYEDIISKLPKGIIFLSQSDRGIPFEIGGVKGEVRDYSMSIIGPGEQARTEWRLARERGLKVGAKVQFSTTWEASTVPAIPVAPSIEEHMRRLKEEGVEHVMLSWTLGGYPCANIAAAAKYFYEGCSYDLAKEPTYEAQKQFAEAFKEFPFHIMVLYKGPANAGPSSLLFEEPTGYKSTMTGYAYDDLESWRSIYPVDVFEDQFAKLCDKWEKGLAMLPEQDDTEVSVMAKGTYCLFRSSLNQIRFVRARDEGRYADAVAAAQSELEIAEQMLQLMNENASIGYEAANHYYFSKGQLAEKILNCHYIIKKFRGK